MIIIKKYKVCVYAIAKNEEKFVKRWYESMKEADKIVVLDTGSTDNTVKLLKELNVDVYEKKYDFFRFDVARNDSLKLIPDDYEICVCTDLDEVFSKGWKKKLLKIWNDDVTRISYTYNWSFDEYKNPATTFMLNKIHKNHYYTWSHPVHEVLTPIDTEKQIECADIILNHYPDHNKSRINYLKLLELSVNEDPLDDRNMHYLGREYMYYQKWNESIRTLKKHLSLDKATWKDERCASMRYIARDYKALNNINKAEEWYLKAIEEAPYLREGYVELAFLYYEHNNNLKAYDYLKKALEIKEKSQSYINEEFAWNSFLYDLNSIVCFNLKKYKEAYENCKKAYELDHNNIRLQINLEEIEKYL